MRFLIDECLRQQLAVALTDLGHDAIHVTDAGLAGRPDNEIIDLARRTHSSCTSATVGRRFRS
ncbi:MAG: DUF5615 family PIN-like protein [Acidimicrobiia bacterium]|nr:DUF5615 family PIN-like protein [Acidimicrobiia bacterium]